MLGLPPDWYGALEFQYPPHQRQGSYEEEGRAINTMKARVVAPALRDTRQIFEPDYVQHDGELSQLGLRTTSFDHDHDPVSDPDPTLDPPAEQRRGQSTAKP